MSLINIQKLFHNIADSHISINSFEMGKGLERGSDSDELYPQLYVGDNITVEVINSTMDQQIYSLTFYILDRVEKNIAREQDNAQYNLIKIASKCERIALDILALFGTLNNVFIQNSPTIELYYADSKDELVGVAVNMRITFPQSVSECDIATIFPLLDTNVLC